MKVVAKVLGIVGLVGAAIAGITYGRRTLRARRTGAASMFVGAVEEVELSGPMRPDQDPGSFDPEEVPSEHSEINELRTKMPFG